MRSGAPREWSWGTGTGEEAPTRGAPATGPAPGRPRIALMLVLLAAAMPVRLSGSILFLNSVSILDILLIVVAVTLFLDLAFRPPNLGYRGLFLLLCVPLVMSVLSLVWSEDRSASLRAVLISLEALVAYLFVVREMRSFPAARVAEKARGCARVRRPSRHSGSQNPTNLASAVP